MSRDDVTVIHMQSRRERFGLCYECKAENHQACIGVPCDCPCEPGGVRLVRDEDFTVEVGAIALTDAGMEKLRAGGLSSGRIPVVLTILNDGRSVLVRRDAEVKA